MLTLIFQGISDPGVCVWLFRSGKTQHYRVTKPAKGTVCSYRSHVCSTRKQAFRLLGLKTPALTF